jgi:hypothetical protein
VSLVVTIIMRTGAALLARTEMKWIVHQVELMRVMSEHVLLIKMDVEAGFHQCRKVTPGPGADVRTTRANVSEVSCMPWRRHILWCMSSFMFFEVDELGKSLVAASCSRANVVLDIAKVSPQVSAGGMRVIKLTLGMISYRRI